MREVDLKEMIEYQIKRRGINQPRLLKAFNHIPRQLFVNDEYQDVAYKDGPLPIGYGQTISQPYIVAYMISELDLQTDDHVLEIGTGCGYQTAILSQLVSSVVSIEIIPELAEGARQVLCSLGIKNVQVLTADGSLGCEQQAPYNAILVSASAPKVPPPLLDQLKDGGRLILPVGSRGSQELEIWNRTGMNFEVRYTIPVTFVPLRGKHGW